jgi:tRNA (guanine-N7-)-methyltransferase
MTTNAQPLLKLSSFNLTWSTNWDDVFGASRPLILEIGFGMGHYLRHLHHRYPDHNIIGLEITSLCLFKAERAIIREGMDNVRVVMSRAETALHHLFTPESLSQVYINYPDPWFKTRHSGRRLIQRDTVDAIVNRLTPGGTVYLATDILAYAEMSHEVFSQTPGLTNTLKTRWVSEMAGRIVTKYEKKARAEGRPSYYFAYQRNDTPAPDVPVIKELTMPHIVFHTPLDLDAMFDHSTADSSATDYQEGEMRVNVMNVYRNVDAILFEVYVHEATIDQRVGVVLTPRPQANEYTLKLSALGNPRPTEGLHKAVGLLGERLLALHPDTRVIHDKVKR